MPQTAPRIRVVRVTVRNIGKAARARKALEREGRVVRVLGDGGKFVVIGRLPNSGPREVRA